MQVQDLYPNQTVGLLSDAVFRGVFYGLINPPDEALGEIGLVYVKEPGATGRKQGAVTKFPVSDMARVGRIMR